MSISIHNNQECKHKIIWISNIYLWAGIMVNMSLYYVTQYITQKFWKYVNLAKQHPKTGWK